MSAGYRDRTGAPAVTPVTPVEVTTTTDIDVVYRLRRLVLRHGELASYGVDSAADHEAGSLHFVACVGEHPVGVMSLIPEPCPGHRGSAVELMGMAVLVDRQRAGVGSALIRHGLDCVTTRYDLVWAHARCSAIGFYRRHGFREVSEVYDILPGVPHRRVVRRIGGIPQADPDARATDVDAPSVAPPDLLAWLRGTFAELLGQPRVGPDDDFFARGGDSMLAAVLAARVKQDTGVRIRLVDFVDASTPRRLAATVAGRGETDTQSAQTGPG